MAEKQKDLKKELLKKDKVELVKILKKKGQPTNGNKADLVSRILEYDEKNGGKMARKASSAKSGDEGEGDPDDYNEDEAKEDEELAPKAKKEKKKPPKKKKKKQNNGGGGGGGGGPAFSGPDCSGFAIASGSGIGLIGQIFTAIAAVGQLIVGIIQFINLAELLEDVCDEDVYDGCFGNALIWDPNGGEETDSFNTPWRYGMYCTLFSLYYQT